MEFPDLIRKEIATQGDAAIELRTAKRQEFEVDSQGSRGTVRKSELNHVLPHFAELGPPNAG